MKRCGKLILAGAVAMVLSTAAAAQHPEPKVVATIGGEKVYEALPVGAIPAIDEPRFVKGPEANAQMRPEELVLGVVMDGQARAYSLWQLDAHEIVNDVLKGTAIAATW